MVSAMPRSVSSSSGGQPVWDQDIEGMMDIFMEQASHSGTAQAGDGGGHHTRRGIQSLEAWRLVRDKASQETRQRGRELELEVLNIRHFLETPEKYLNQFDMHINNVRFGQSKPIYAIPLTYVHRMWRQLSVCKWQQTCSS
eukprot:scaffold38969_cov14-Prasinocladus_malaysianus.AAC.2